MNITEKKVFVDIIQVSSKEESFVMIENSCLVDTTLTQVQAGNR